MSQERILRLPDVLEKTGLSRSTIYALVKHGNFPKQVRLSRRAVGWHSSDISNWIDRRENSTPCDP